MQIQMKQLNLQSDLVTRCHMCCSMLIFWSLLIGCLITVNFQASAQSTADHDLVNVSVCNTTLDGQRYQLMMQNGKCSPYLRSASHRSIPCDTMFIPGVDYVYVPNSRAEGDQQRLRTAIESGTEFLTIVNNTNPKCFESVTKALCIHFYLPCGFNDSRHVPQFLCPDTCYYLSDVVCRTLWWIAVQQLQDLGHMGLFLPVCSNPSMDVSFLNLSEDCCSTGGVIIPPANTDLFVTSSSTFTLASYPGSRLPGYEATSTLISSAVGGGLVLFIAMTIISSFLLCWMKRRRKMGMTNRLNHNDKNFETDKPIYSHGTPTVDTNTLTQSSSATSPRVAPTYFKQLDDFIIPGTQVQLIETLGQGEFGIVYRGLLMTKCGQEEMTKPIAVKTLKGQFSSEDISSIMEESLKMKLFDHPNVLTLVGVCVDSGPAPYILMPFMSNGSLLSYLKKERHNLTVAEGSDQELVSPIQKQLLSMCLQVAQGMSYLASLRYVHRDLAARNCMIDANGIIKVADFGLTEDIYQRNYFRQDSCTIKLPVKWMAPECIHDMLFTEKTDVWAFGVTSWEVFSLGRMPYPSMSPAEVVKFLDEGSRLSKPNNAACSEEIYGVMMSCWGELPDNRPSFAKLVETLTSTLEPRQTTVHCTTTKNTNGSGYDRLEPKVFTNSIVCESKQIINGLQ